MSAVTAVKLIPMALKDTPALIGAVFPAQKVSFEAQAERKAVAAQTLTGLGSYWKGRKPLILVRAIVLGSLLPQTEDAEKDLEVFEKLMAFDDEGLARRALAQNMLKPKDIAARIELDKPWDYFAYSLKKGHLTTEQVEGLCLPLDAEAEGISIRWRRDIEETDKLLLIGLALATFDGYEEKAALCKRPEELDQEWLYAPVWTVVNQYYAHFGIEAYSHQALIDQLGLLRYGHRPRVGDVFAGGGSIPFEAARLGCDVYASDLNPIACMLTWGALNIIGASAESRTKIDLVQKEVADKVDKEITKLGIEYDEEGNRAKAYLYCLETQCPETGWLIPLSPSWVVSPKKGAVARLIPDYQKKRFNIEVVSGVSAAELKKAEQGTIRDGCLVYELDGKAYHTPIKTLRGDYRDAEGNTKNRLRLWEKLDFKPRSDDVFQERLYAIQWITKETLEQPRQETFFSSVTENDLERESKVENIVERNLARWQDKGLVPDMEIEPGGPPRYQGKSLIVNLGWQYWHHLFNARQLLLLATAAECWMQSSMPQLGMLNIAKMADFNAKLCRWKPSQGGGLGGPVGVFSNQALNSFYNYATRSWAGFGESSFKLAQEELPPIEKIVISSAADKPAHSCEFWVTDPPYADAVMYHEITEFFIGWLRKNPPAPFDQWVWDSRRALAIKGSGDDFRRGMVDAYRAMTDHMPENGMQCVMFTHQDTAVWSDMVSIFWVAGLQVIAAWYIATETNSELKKGGFVQGTVILMLRKRPGGERSGFKQRILPAVRNEVKAQIEQMMHLNDDVEQKFGEPVFNDSDLQMAGYAAALKVLTAYTHIGGEDVTAFALRPRQRGDVTVVDEIVQQASEAANSLLVPESLGADTWQRISGIQRFYLRMLDIETTGAAKLDNYQNFAKAFRVSDYTKVMGSMTANKARLKRVSEFISRDLTDSTELGATWLGRLIIGLQQLLADAEPQVVISQLQTELPDFMEVRPVLIDQLQFIHLKAPEPEVRTAAEVLANRLRNMRALGQ